MGKITPLIFSCTLILLLGLYSFAKQDASATLSQLTTPPPEAAVKATSMKAKLPPAYLITPMKVLESNKYTEGVVFDREGNLYFSETEAGTITVLSPNGSRRLWAKVDGANGHKIASDGTHIVAAKNSVVQLDTQGKLLKVVAKEFNGKLLQYPNDITIDPQGGFYFTDSGAPNSQNPTGAVYYVNSAGKTNQVLTGVAFANGLLLSPDRKRLFVNESKRNRVLVYDVHTPGKVGSQKVFASLPVKQGEQIDNQPDGMCMDAMGNLYLAHYGMRQVQVLNPDGFLIRSFSSGNLTTSNCAFGGSNLDRLFVTGSIEKQDGVGGIFRLDLGVPGLDILPKQ